MIFFIHVNRSDFDIMFYVHFIRWDAWRHVGGTMRISSAANNLQLEAHKQPESPKTLHHICAPQFYE